MIRWRIGAIERSMEPDTVARERPVGVHFPNPDLVARLRPRDREMEDGARSPVHRRLDPALVIARVATALPTVPPDELHPGPVAVGALFEVHFPAVIAERAEIAPRCRITHGEPLQILAQWRAHFLSKLRHIKFHRAGAAGGEVVVDAIAGAGRFPALIGDERPANPRANGL